MPKQGKPARLDYSSEFGLPRTYQQTYGLQCVFFVLCDILLFSGVTMMLEIRFVNEIVTSCTAVSRTAVLNSLYLSREISITVWYDTRGNSLSNYITLKFAYLSNRILQ